MTFERPISLCYSLTLDHTCEEIRRKYCTYLDRVGAFRQRAEILQCCEAGRSQETLSLFNNNSTTSTITTTNTTNNYTSRAKTPPRPRKRSIDYFQDPREPIEDVSDLMTINNNTSNTNRPLSPPPPSLSTLFHSASTNSVGGMSWTSETSGKSDTLNNGPSSMDGGADGSLDTNEDVHIVTVERRMACSLCERPTIGMSFVCVVCGHGGHVACYSRWFRNTDENKEENKEDNDEKEVYMECPTGCGCDCVAASKWMSCSMHPSYGTCLPSKHGTQCFVPAEKNGGMGGLGKEGSLGLGKVRNSSNNIAGGNGSGSGSGVGIRRSRRSRTAVGFNTTATANNDDEENVAIDDINELLLLKSEDDEDVHEDDDEDEDEDEEDEDEEDDDDDDEDDDSDEDESNGSEENDVDEDEDEEEIDEEEDDDDREELIIPEEEEIMLPSPTSNVMRFEGFDDENNDDDQGAFMFLDGF